jgi:hypothetical protein
LLYNGGDHDSFDSRGCDSTSPKPSSDVRKTRQKQQRFEMARVGQETNMKDTEEEDTKSLARIIVKMILRFGHDAAMKFGDIYLERGLDNALDYKNSLEDDNDNTSESDGISKTNSA